MESELPFLASLNVAQKAAVVHPPDVALQILAGPGSGKTKVLTSRIAYLILRHAITPSSVCAVTFTNKAANEMKERLQHLIGKEKTRQLKMGTFHALCAQFLRKHGKLVGIGENFTICDTSESESLIARCINSFKGNIAKVDAEVKPGTIRSTISNAKSRGFGPREFLEDAAKKWVKPDAFTEVVGEIFREYNNELRASNSLDFDDLLLYGVRLFKRHQKVAAWCQHILVDEFQDTNCVQYEIMKLISETHRCVTIVGDPDQSIYGWRSADILNISNMQRDFPLTEQIYLEQNYRSTGSILNVSLAIISKDDKRIKKSLRTSYNEGPRPMLCHFGSEHQEAQFAASEIKRIVAYSGGMFGWKDFVVLLRFNALSRGLESALQAEGIPYRVLKGHKFFDRAEIKDLLAYLQVLDNPSFLPAFTRIVNVPPRGLGEKSVSQIIARAENDKKSPLETMERIADGKIPDTKPPLRKKIAPFVKVMHEMRKAAESGAGPAELLRQLIGLIEYEEYMKRTQPDAESRLDNILELINFASQEHQAIEIDPVKVDTPTTTPVLGDATGLPKRHTPYGGVSASSESTPGTSPVPADTQKETPLRLFLQTSMLSTDSDTSEDGSENKVTISTCHAAKGLEWPVVFVPAAEDKVFPFARSEDEYEERRLLYVACTRAQCLLYVLHAEKRMVAGSTLKKTLTPFVSSIGNDLQQLFSNELPDLSSSTVEIMAKIAGRPTPDTKEIRRRVKDFDASALPQRLKDLVAPAPNANYSAAGGMAHTGAFRVNVGGEQRGPAPAASFVNTSLIFKPRSAGYPTGAGNAAQIAKPRSTSHSFPQHPLPQGHQPTTHSQSRAPRLPLSPSRSPAEQLAWHVPSTSKPLPEVHQRQEQEVHLKPRSAPRPGQGMHPTQRTLHSRTAPESTQNSTQKLTRAGHMVHSTFENDPPFNKRREGSQAGLAPTTQRMDQVEGTTPGSPVTGVKRRLGMGRSAVSYANKKFKTPAKP